MPQIYGTMPNNHDVVVPWCSNIEHYLQSFNTTYDFKNTVHQQGWMATDRCWMENKCWTEVKRMSNGRWTKVGQKSNENQLIIGRTSNECQTDVERTLNESRLIVEQTLDKSRPIVGQMSNEMVERHNGVTAEQ